MTHISVGKLTIIGSDNGLPPERRQAIIWTNAGLLLIRPLGTNFSEILIEILTFSFKKMRLKVSSAKRPPFCLGLNMLSLCYVNFCRDESYNRTKLMIPSTFELKTFSQGLNRNYVDLRFISIRCSWIMFCCLTKLCVNIYWKYFTNTCQLFADLWVYGRTWYCSVAIILLVVFNWIY